MPPRARLVPIRIHPPQRWLQHPAFVSRSLFAVPEPLHTIQTRRQALTALGPSPNELARRVEALAVPAQNEGVPPGQTYSEEELLALYDDLLSLPPDKSQVASHSPAKPSIEEHDNAAVETILSRLSPSPLPSALPDTFSASLQQRAEPTFLQYSPETQSHAHESPPSLPHHVALSLLTPIIQGLHSTSNVLAPSGPDSPLVSDVPLAILSVNEWRSLTRVCLAHDDLHSVKMTLQLMMASGIQLVEDHANDVLGWFARRGDVLGLEEFLQKFVKGPLTDRQRHLHIKAHEKSVPPGTIPESALFLLHSYENAGRPPPMTTYSRLITALFHTPSSLAHAQAWDLFSHMRYVAHPHPDSLLFTQMIQACAIPNPAEPERALDLFTEMTVDREIPPTAGAYTAAILACARSGSKVYVNEAFRLAKEMLDAHRDARGRGAFRPDSHTFRALLEGAKRIGDLGRVRWILAEMVKAARTKSDSRDVVVDERIMTHVFHSYAAYKPPFRRSMAPLATQTQNKVDADTPVSAKPAEPVESSASEDRELSPPVEASQEPSFAHLPPQSRSEVIGEARALFSRIARLSPSPPATDSPLGTPNLPALPDVHVTPRLLAAYLSVFYAHAPLETAHAMFRAIFAEHGLAKDARALVEALERCAAARRGAERAYLHGFAEEVWNEWTALENARTQMPTLVGERNSGARYVQRAHSARIRVLALTGRVDEALACLRAFAARYPPSAVRESSSPRTAQGRGRGRPDMRAMRVSLAGRDRPLVRLTTALDEQDDLVPPLLTFADVEVLHHRLVAAGDLRGLAYVKWVCKTYEGALRKRREETLKV
ncbi:hypothetical protein BC827DRAFT_1185755 [Russula dissimulans]|nr:hypothetical protein BC827DRAFT_1185755 [Russula dissimulans]